MLGGPHGGREPSTEADLVAAASVASSCKSFYSLLVYLHFGSNFVILWDSCEKRNKSRITTSYFASILMSNFRNKTGHTHLTWSTSVLIYFFLQPISHLFLRLFYNLHRNYCDDFMNFIHSHCTLSYFKNMSHLKRDFAHCVLTCFN